MAKQNKPDETQDTKPEQATTDNAQSSPVRKELSDVEKMQERRRKDMAFKRAMQTFRETDDKGRAEIYDKVHLVRSVNKPTTLKGKWANYWYHHSFTTVVVGFILVLMGWFIYDMATQIHYDFETMFLTNGAHPNMEEQLDPVKENLAKYIPDKDNSGKIDIAIDNIALNFDDIENEDPNIVMANTTKYSVSFTEASTLVYLMDNSFYDTLSKQEIEFEDLSKFGANPNIDGDKYYIKDDEDFSSLNGKEEMFLVVRKQDNIIAKNDKKKKELAKRFEETENIVAQILAE